jgi:hypothetical protein
VIVCNPGHVLSQSREKDYEAKRTYQQKYGETKGNNPFIMVLDSLGGSHSTAVSKIRSYLTFEHMEKKNLPRTFGKEKMGEKHPPIPLQPNSCDCGLFLLHYVELIFKDPEMFLGAMLPDLSKWFNTTDIDYKREDIALLIQRIANGDSNTIKFPKIKFPAQRNYRGSNVGSSDNNIDEDTPLARRISTPSARKMSTPSARRMSDPRLRKAISGTMGELLAIKQKVGRPSRFTYEPPRTPSSPPPRSTPRRTMTLANSAAAVPEAEPKTPGLFESPLPAAPKISFEIKKSVHAPKSPSKDDFKTSSDPNKMFLDKAKVLLAKVGEKSSSSSSSKTLRTTSSSSAGTTTSSSSSSSSLKTTRSSAGGTPNSSGWKSISRRSHEEPLEQKSLSKRFVLKRNNAVTNPDRHRDDKGYHREFVDRCRDMDRRRDQPVKSGAEMYDFLMKNIGES